ncbi:MAG TPA: sensor domain-containing diguanylate cyclase, partial [Burkholderiales bacterium]|nr:sensor domain-containing diguanylate cyclase [Burkholderiales bacterium]
RHAIEELKHQKEFSEVIINSLPGIFYMLDVKGGIVKVNPQFLEVTGYSDAEISEMNVLDFFDEKNVPLIKEQMATVFSKGESSMEAELVVKGGSEIPYFLTNHKTLINGKNFLVGLGTDISERRMLEEELVHQARTDMLTGLPNRRRFLELAEQELTRAKRYGSLVSILMIDLDEFKSINDIYGHQTGDRVLVKFAEICGKTMRSIDVAGRIGGEEFAVILPETDMIQALDAAERLRQSVASAEMQTEEGSSFSFTASIGVATLSPEQDDLDSLLGSADQALYEAKRSGRNRVFRA